MKKSSDTKQQVKRLQKEVSALEATLAETYIATGTNPHVSVKVRKNQARFERIRKKGVSDKGIGHYFMQFDLTAKSEMVYVPLSIASGKKPTGFSYQIEGTGDSAVESAAVECRGDQVTQVTIGTLQFAKIPRGETATFRIQIKIQGAIGKVFAVTVYRLNYKLDIAETRYRQYRKEWQSDTVEFS
jgi:hypothetical protein